jgi:RNA polymerase-binding transcription factor DksA
MSLSKDDLQRLQQRLDEREAELRAEVQGARAEEAERPSEQGGKQQGDFGDQGEEHIRGAVRYAEQERDIEELRDIDDARERMAEGSYGECITCGCEIPLQRLMVQPTAKRCIHCQEVFERTHQPTPHIADGL